MRFTIDRATLRCGGIGKNKHGEGETTLLNKEGFMCVLGQVCLQLRIPKEKILNIDQPKNISSVRRKILSCKNKFTGNVQNTLLCYWAMDINDDIRINDIEREDKLKSLFYKEGHQLKFINDYI